MDNISIQDMDAFTSIQTVLGDLATAGGKREFLSRAYFLDNKDGRNAELDAFMGGRVLDFNMLCACIGCHNHPTPVMIT